MIYCLAVHFIYRLSHVLKPSQSRLEFLCIALYATKWGKCFKTQLSVKVGLGPKRLLDTSFLIWHWVITIYNFWTVYCATQQLILLDYKYLDKVLSFLLYITSIYGILQSSVKLKQ